MPRKLTGEIKLVDGEFQVRLSVYTAPKKRERKLYKLGTADESAAKRRVARLIAELDLARRNMLATAAAAPAASPTPASIVSAPAMPRFEAYAREVHKKRKDEGVAMVDSELSNLELHIFPANVGTDEASLLFGTLLLGDVRPKHVLRVLESVRGKGKSKGTVSHVRAVMRRVMQAALEAELVRDNVVAKVRVPKVRGDIAVKRKRLILTDREVETFFGCEEADLEIRMLGLVARVQGGARTRDLTAWDWTMINVRSFGRCTVPRTKTLTPQEMAIPAVLQAPLRRWWVSRGSPTSGPVFPVRKGKRQGEARLARGVSFAKRLRRALVVAGIFRLPPVEVPARRAGTRTDLGRRAAGTVIGPDPKDPLHFETATSRPVDFHSFRRAFKTRLAEEGVPTERAMLLSGSSDPRAHALYIVSTPALAQIPDAALPAFGGKGIERDPVGGLPKNPERDTGFEPATLSLGRQEPSANTLDSAETQGEEPPSSRPAVPGSTGHGRERDRKGIRLPGLTKAAVREGAAASRGTVLARLFDEGVTLATARAGDPAGFEPMARLLGRIAAVAGGGR